MNISDERFQRMKERHLKKKILSLGGSSSASEVCKEGVSVGEATGGDAERERTPSPIVPPLDIPDTPMANIYVPETEEEPAPKKRRRLVRLGEKVKAGKKPVGDGSSVEPFPVRKISRSAWDERPLLEFPSGAPLDSSTLNSFWYKGADLAPFCKDRLLLPDDYNWNSDLADRIGVTKFARRAVTQLARGFSDVLSLIPAVSNLEKDHEKFKGLDPNQISGMQSQLDSALGELHAFKADLAETKAQLESSAKELGTAQLAKAELEGALAESRTEKEKLSEEAKLKDQQITLLQEQLAGREKELVERQRENAELQDMVDKVDDDLMGMFVRGFHEAREQILFFNKSLPIDLSDVSEEKEIEKIKGAEGPV